MEFHNKISKINSDIYKSHSKTLSVSKCIEYIQKPFNQIEVATKCFNKGFNDPESKYYQMTVEQIVEQWQEKALTSCRYGSLIDSYIEHKLTKSLNELEDWRDNNNFKYDTRLSQLCKGFDDFYSVLKGSTDYEYVSREEKMYIKSKDTGNYINGRFDCLFYSPSLNKYSIIDWKTNEKIESENKWENLLGPMYKYSACNLNTYSVQVSMYKKALIETYEIAPDENSVNTYICQFLTEPNEKGLNFIFHKVGFQYDSHLLDQIIDFGYEKNAKKEKEEKS